MVHRTEISDNADDNQVPDKERRTHGFDSSDLFKCVKGFVQPDIQIKTTRNQRQ
ncbi:hypothetical protein D3C81_2301230 [compost metagenome]